MSFFSSEKKWFVMLICLWLGVCMIMQQVKDKQEVIAVSGRMSGPMEGIIVDRIEGGCALCEDETGEFRRIELSLLPSGLEEGDVIKYTQQGYVIDDIEKKNRLENIVKQADQLWD